MVWAHCRDSSGIVWGTHQFKMLSCPPDLQHLHVHLHECAGKTSPTSWLPGFKGSAADRPPSEACWVPGLMDQSLFWQQGDLLILVRRLVKCLCAVFINQSPRKLVLCWNFLNISISILGSTGQGSGKDQGLLKWHHRPLDLLVRKCQNMKWQRLKCWRELGDYNLVYSCLHSVLSEFCSFLLGTCWNISPGWGRHVLTAYAAVLNPGEGPCLLQSHIVGAFNWNQAVRMRSIHAHMFCWMYAQSAMKQSECDTDANHYN